MFVSQVNIMCISHGFVSQSNLLPVVMVLPVVILLPAVYCIPTGHRVRLVVAAAAAATALLFVLLLLLVFTVIKNIVDMPYLKSHSHFHFHSHVLSNTKITSNYTARSCIYKSISVVRL